MNLFKHLRAIAAFLAIVLVTSASAAEVNSAVAALKQGHLVIVFRHMATDDSQADIYPFRFDDMKAQRQLSDAGREAARKLGAATQGPGNSDGQNLHEQAQPGGGNGRAALGKRCYKHEQN